jgi:hypothetical protein
MMRMDVANGRNKDRVDPSGRRFVALTIQRAITPIAKTRLAATGMAIQHCFKQRRRTP